MIWRYCEAEERHEQTSKKTKNRLFDRAIKNKEWMKEMNIYEMRR